MLEQVRSIGLQDMQVIVLADRGFVHEQLLHYIRTHDFHLRLRLMSNTLVHLLDQPVSAVKDLCPPGFRESVLSARSAVRNGCWASPPRSGRSRGFPR